MDPITKYLSVDYEVFGKVQGVYFRDNTVKQADSLGIKGWVRNTDKETVEGVIQGAPEKMTEMMKWLREVGPPNSKIDKCEFKNEKEVEKLDYTDFQRK